MAKKKKKEKETTIEDFYDLKSDEMDELVAALKGDVDESKAEPLPTNIEEITGEHVNAKPGSKKAEFDPYRKDKLSAVPTWIKAIFVKWWFAGLVCFLFIFGVRLDPLDAAFVCGFVLGIVTDVLVNPIFHYFESDRKEYDAYMMFPFPFKKYWTFLTNILYYLIVMAGVFGCYFGINALCNYYSGADIRTYLGVEPLLFGTFAVIIDMIFIGIKDLIVYLVKKAKRNKEVADV